MLYNALEELSIICGMNQRYHQYEWSWWSNWNTLIAVGVALLSLASAILTVIGYYRKEPRSHSADDGSRWARFKRWAPTLGTWSLTASLASLAAATALNIIPTNQQSTFYSDMFRRWSDLRVEVDSLKTEVGFHKDAENDKAAELFAQKRYQDLLARKNNLNALEPVGDQKKLLQFLEEEEQSRTIEPTKSATATASVVGMHR